MSDYTDFWKELDLPVDRSQKAIDFNTVTSNADRLNLTDAERYNLGWGMDATPEAWVKAKAQEIQNQINGAKSTDILKRGLDKAPLSPEELAAKEKEDATTTASEKAALAAREGGSGGDYGGPTNSNPSASAGIDASTHPDEAAAAKAAMATLGFGDLVGAVTIGPTSWAKTAVDAAKAYNTTVDGLLSDRIAVSENSLRASAAARAAERAAEAAATQAQAKAQADAAAGIGPAGMGGGGYDSSVGPATNASRADGGWGGGSGGFGTGPGSGGTSSSSNSNSDSNSTRGGGGRDPG